MSVMAGLDPLLYACRRKRSLELQLVSRFEYQIGEEGISNAEGGEF